MSSGLLAKEAGVKLSPARAEMTLTVSFALIMEVSFLAQKQERQGIRTIMSEPLAKVETTENTRNEREE